MTSKANLVNHKQMVYSLVGRVYEQEHKWYVARIENKNINDDMKFWINNWEAVRCCPFLKARLEAVGFDELEDFHLQTNKAVKE